MSLKEQSPKPSYVVSDKVLIAVIDERNNGKSRSYFGTAYGPLYNDDLYIEDLADQKGDEKRDLAEYLSLRIVTGLNENKWYGESLHLKTTPSADMAELLLAENGARYLIVLGVKEWVFSMNKGDVAFIMNTDTDILVYQATKGRVLDTNIKREREIPTNAGDFLNDVVQAGFKLQTTEIVNDRKLREALGAV